MSKIKGSSIEPQLALYYERVSTVSDDQDSSMENQRRLAETYLARHPEIKLAEPLSTYSERISAKSDLRPRFQELLERLERGDIRFLMIKDEKRLSRSVEVSAKLMSHAKKYNYRFIFLATGQILDPSQNENRLMYSFSSILAENVVIRQSEYARLAHQQKVESKRLNRNNVTFGYRWNAEKKDIEINSEEAELVRGLFSELIFRDAGKIELKKWLAQKGVCVCQNTVSNWLSETAYIGIFHLGKKGSELGVGAGEKTIRYRNPESLWVPVNRPDLRILDDETFELAQKVIENRKKRYGLSSNGVSQERFSGYHIFSSILYCGECGNSYHHKYIDRKKLKGIYYDSYNSKAKDISVPCPNTEYKRISEPELIEACCSVINTVVRENESVFAMVLATVEHVIQNKSDKTDLVKEKKERIKCLTKEAENVLQSFVHASGALFEQLNERYNKLDYEIGCLREEVVVLQNKRSKTDELKERISRIQEVLARWSPITVEQLDRNTIKLFIKRITVYKEGRITILLNSDREFTYELVKKEKSLRGISPSVIVLPTDIGLLTKQIEAVIQCMKSGEKKQCNMTVMEVSFEKTKKNIIEVQLEIGAKDGFEANIDKRFR